MAIISRIEEQKKNKNRVNIYVDDEFFLATYKELVYAFGLKKGMDIDEESLRPIMEKEMYMKAQNKALNIISRSDKSEKTLRDRLLTEFEEGTVDKVIDFLKKYSFVDDETFAKRLTEKNSSVNKWGKNKIKQNLYSKGLSKENIADAMSTIDEDTEYQNALYAAKKKYNLIKDRDDDKRKIYQKLYQHLAYKGFNYEVTKRVINEVLNFSEFDY
ncbi:MAG: recombination regulator RecX [Clostridioides sp.]|jgi:regulatory protein|nr:recombination regulator RecX [Clostridioides sp.]